MKLYNLGLEKNTENKLYELLDAEGIYDSINDLIREFDSNHNYIWQAGFNGRNGGYLVLYQGERKPSGYKSYCTSCGQLNYTAVEETGNKCGRCGQETRRNFSSVHYAVNCFPGRPTDMHEDFEDWDMYQLRERVKLVCEFDKLADDIVAEAVYLAENFDVEEETYYLPKKRKVLVESAS